jgi:hypothetical protein
MELLRNRYASLGGARNPHVQEVRSGCCAPSALPDDRSLRSLNHEPKFLSSFLLKEFL